jgi:fido (protein-threonine AMPylation protein)
LLDDARFWAAHRTYPPLQAAARFHHRLVQIHLFANGNGRHARVAADMFLQDYFDLPPVVWADGFDLVGDRMRRESYIAALRAADKGEFRLLLQFVGAR